MATIRRTVRLPDHIGKRVDQVTKERGHRTSSAFIRAAIENELSGRQGQIAAAEERIAATVERLARDLRAVRSSQQALFAFIDTLAKTILTCIPEPTGDGYEQAVARARLRYDRFVKSAGQGMAGDSKLALSRLTTDAE